MPIKETKKETRKAKEGGGGEGAGGGGLAKGKKKEKKSPDCCVTFKPKKFCFLRMPELCNLVFSFGSESREVFDL